jgi:hypothetical protein
VLLYKYTHGGGLSTIVLEPLKLVELQPYATGYSLFGLKYEWAERAKGGRSLAGLLQR